MEQLSSFLSSHSVLPLENFLALTKTSHGHIKEVFIPFLSALLSRIYKPREFKHEGAQVGAGARGTDGKMVSFMWLQYRALQVLTSGRKTVVIVTGPFLMVKFLTLF